MRINRFILFFYLAFTLIFASCTQSVERKNQTKIELAHILKTTKNPKGLLVLFPMYGSTLYNTDFETKIDDVFFNEGYSVVFIGFNHQFFLNESDFYSIKNIVDKIVNDYNIPSNNILMGGFSTGGNIALNYGIWVHKLKLSKNKPKGIFIGDSPIDLEKFYAQKKGIVDNPNKYNEGIVAMCEYYLDVLDKSLGNPATDLDKYLEFSPFIYTDINNSNIIYLKDYPIRIYCEPDVEWYKEVANFDFKDINAIQIELFYKTLKKMSSKRIEYIQTKNKGLYDGEKAPHSWSIIEPNELLDWMISLN